MIQDFTLAKKAGVPRDIFSIPRLKKVPSNNAKDSLVSGCNWIILSRDRLDLFSSSENVSVVKLWSKTEQIELSHGGYHQS